MRSPPRILWVAAAYGAGLATGLAHLKAPLLLILLAIVVLVAHRKPLGRAITVVAVAGWLGGGTGLALQERTCSAVMPEGDRAVRLHLIDPGEGSGRVRMLGAQCTGSIVAHWPRSIRIEAGADVRASARWRPSTRLFARRDGILSVTAAEVIASAPSLTERARTAVVAITRAQYGERAPLANALLAGWRGEIDAELKDAFASAGLMHLLSVSGFHVAWLAGMVLLCLRLFKVNRHCAEAIAVFTAMAYTAWLGWPAAALRATIVLLFVVGTRWRQRSVQFIGLLAASALVLMIIDPWSLTEPGAWLSLLGVIGVVAAIRWSERAVGRLWWVQGIAASAGALITTAPVAAATFGQVAPIGILLNLAGMPLILLLLPAVFGSVLSAHVVGPVATGLSASGNGLLSMLELLARTGATLPGSATAATAGIGAAFPWCLMLVAATWVTWQHSTAAEAGRRLAWCVVVCTGATLLAGSGATTSGNGQALTLLFVDVGQGDAALIRTPHGHWIEVDAGPVGEGHDAGRQVIAPILVRERVARLDLFVLSHAHRDHVGGAATLVDRLPVLLSLEPGQLFADSAYEDWLRALRGKKERWRAARAGDRWVIDSVEFRVLHPPLQWPHQGEDLNEDSIVLEVRFGAFRALLMGDAGLLAESELRSALGAVNVLKVGHHGSRGASGDDFLGVVRPQVAVISVGRNNYGHPSPEALDRLGAAHAQVWRTDMDGTVKVTTDGKNFSVEGARRNSVFPTAH